MRLRIHNYYIVAQLAVAFVIVLGLTVDVMAGNRHPKELSGGETTVFDSTSQAFTLPLGNLSVEQMRDFAFGNRLFNTNWVTAPSSTSKFDGLGPTFNRISCSACHTFDGRGRPPEAGKSMETMLVRISLPGVGEYGGVVPHPNYGDQINDRAITGVPIEGRVNVSYSYVKGKYPDGESYELRVPRYDVVDLNFGPLGANILMSPRVAPAVFGLGLLEVVDDDTIIGFAKSQEKSKDGVSGRVNMVWDKQHQRHVIGRFGWKANQPSLAQQDAGALVGDIGITNPINPDEGTPVIQHEARQAISGGSPELDDNFFAKLLFYSRTLGVPARRDIQDKDVIKGEKLFNRIGCAVCHVPTMKTGIKTSIKQLANQTIHPYTDLLIHDMGDGLVDGRPDFQATGNEWRTPPLWGIGLVKIVNKHTMFMHDGRARNFEEAILWHGGEAEFSKKNFKSLSAIERKQIIRFLESL